MRQPMIVDRPALIVVDINNGFTDPASPLVCELEETVEAIRRLLDAMRRAEGDRRIGLSGANPAAGPAPRHSIAKCKSQVARAAGAPPITSSKSPSWKQRRIRKSARY